VCCGTEREVSLDCPPDCTYLIRARQQEGEHRPPVPRAEVPFAGVEIPAGVVDLNRHLIGVLATAILGFAQQTPSLTDADTAVAFAALAESFRTLSSGLYYEKPPEGGPPRALYAHLAEAVKKMREEQSARAGFPAAKDSDIYYTLVFLARVLRSRANGRRRCRAFLDFLRAQFPRTTPETTAEAPRIIVP
jgi:hypothetical protein